MELPKENQPDSWLRYHLSPEFQLKVTHWLQAFSNQNRCRRV